MLISAAHPKWFNQALPMFLPAVALSTALSYRHGCYPQGHGWSVSIAARRQQQQNTRRFPRGMMSARWKSSEKWNLRCPAVVNDSWHWKPFIQEKTTCFKFVKSALRIAIYFYIYVTIIMVCLSERSNWKTQGEACKSKTTTSTTATTIRTITPQTTNNNNQQHRQRQPSPQPALSNNNNSNHSAPVGIEDGVLNHSWPIETKHVCGKLTWTLRSSIQLGEGR